LGHSDLSVVILIQARAEGESFVRGNRRAAEPLSRKGKSKGKGQIEGDIKRLTAVQ
jgi:hypothetical protein